MPISDEIIELAPVKKTKSKLIILFAVIGVLFALAVTFLILYFLKPSAVADNGKVLNVGISSSSELFSTTDDGGNQVFTASVGNDYTVYATVAVEGNKSPEVTWVVEPSQQAINIKESGRVDDKQEVNGTLISAASSAPEYKFYCTFSPNEEYAGQKITLAAMSASSGKLGKIEFTVVKQGTEHIVLTTYRRGQSSTQSAIENDTLELPWFSAPNFRPDPAEQFITTNDPFYVNFNQYGAYDVSSDTYSKITVDRTKNTSDVRIDVVSGSDVIRIANTNPGSSRFSFTLRKVGTAVVKIVANINNDYIADGHEVSKTLTIKSVSSESLGYIDGMYFTDQPVTAETFASLKNTSVPPASLTTDTLTVPYSIATYPDILTHLILTPYSLQYDEKTGKLKDDWKSRIDIIPSDKTICNVTGTDITCRKLAANSDCLITFRDKSENTIGVYKRIKLGVAASVNNVALDYKTDAGSDVEVDSVTGAIKSALGVSYNLTVTYNISVPSGTDAKTLIAGGYLSGNFKIGADKNFVTVKTKSGRDIPLNTESSFVESDMTFSGTGTSIKGTAELVVTVKSSGIENGDYDLTFTKLGIMFGNDPNKAINRVNPEIVKTTKFTITAVARRAYFIGDAAGDASENGYAAAQALVTVNGTSAGKFVNTSAAGETKNYSATVYVQAGSNGSPVSGSVDLIRLIDKDGAGSITGVISNRSGGFDGRSGADYSTLNFGNINISNINTSSSLLTFEVSDYHNVIATFKITVKLVNAITAIRCNNAEVEKRAYSAQKDNSWNFPRQTIVPTREISLGNETLASNKTTVSMYYDFGGSQHKFAEVEDDIDGTPVTRFRLTKTGENIFTYNGSSFTQEADLFEVAYNNNITLSTIYVRYTAVKEENYTQEPVYCEKVYNFMRMADGSKLYADEDYNIEVKSVSDPYTFTYTPEFNQGSSGGFWVSSFVTVNISDTEAKDVVINKELKASATLSEAEPSYILLPERHGLSNVTGDPYTGVSSGNAYNYFRFTAPDVAENQTSQYYDFQLIRANTGAGTDVRLTVNNMARRVVSVGIFSDDLGNTPVSEFDFGMYNKNLNAGVLPYTKEAYIIITYEPAKAGVHSYFEHAILQIPDYLEAKVGEGGNYVSDARRDVYRSDTYVSDAETVYVQKCTFRVLETSANHSGELGVEKITLSVESSSVATHEVRAKVGAGLKDISYTVDGIVYRAESAQKLTVNLQLKENGDKTQKCVVPFDFDALAGTGYGKIKYDDSYVTITANDLTDAGLTASGSKKDGLIIAADGSKTVKDRLVSFTFTDKAGYATGEAGATFTINFNVNVTTDIYAVELRRLAIRVTTTGGSGIVDQDDKDQAKLTLIINNDNEKFVPEESIVKGINVRIVKKSGDEYVPPDSTDNIAVDREKSDPPKGLYYLNIANTVLTSKINGVESYFVELSYGDIKPAYYPIYINTTANELRLGADGNNVSLNADNKAHITVKGPADRFKLGASVYNRGDETKVTSGVTVKYALYADPSRTDAHKIADSDTTAAVNAIADIDEFGEIKLLNPDRSGTGTLYYRATYTDASSGITYNEDAVIEYRVTIAKISLKDLGDSLNLHYIDRTHYTQLDLRNYISVETAFSGVAIPATGVTVTVTSNDTDFIEVVDDYALRPLKLSDSAGSITVSAVYSDEVYGTTPVSRTYSVGVSEIAAPDFIFDKNSVNIIANETVTVTPNVVKYDWLDYTYTVVSYDVGKFTVTPSAGAVTGVLAADTTLNVSLKRDGFTNQSDYNNGYRFRLRVTYKALPAAVGTTMIGGTIDCEYTLNVTWSLDGVSFNIVGSKDGSDTVYAGGTSAAPTSIAHDSQATYTLKLDLSDNTKACGGTYTVTSDNANIISFGSTKSNTATVGDGGVEINTGDGFGTVMLTVTANVYGKSLGFAKYFTVTYNGATGIALEMSSDNGDNFRTVQNGGSIDIDFDNETYKRIIRYYIDVSGVGVSVAVGDINVVYSGNVSVNKAAYDGIIFKAADGRFYVEFVASKPTTLVARGTVIVGGRTYYADEATLELNAAEPDFVFTYKVGGTDSSQMYQENTATLALSFASNGFKGESEVEYKLVSGGDYATLSGGVITPKKNATSDEMIVVGATLKITGGAYAGKTYYKERSLTLRGVALPALTLASTEKMLVVTGNTVTENTAYNFVLGKGIATGKDYDYSDKVDYEYFVTAPVGYTSADYSVNGSRITVNNTDIARAGGSFTVYAVATVKNGEINAGKTVKSDVYTVRIKPQAYAVSGVAVSGQKGNYDIRGAAKPYSGAADGQIKETDNYNISYTLKNGSAVIRVNGVDKLISEVVTVSGGTLSLSENITSKVDLQLTATVTMSDGEYAGEIMTCDTLVTVNGFTVSDKEINFIGVVGESAVNAYQELDVSDWVSASVSGNVTQIDVAVIGSGVGAFVKIDSADKTAPIVTFDRDIHVSNNQNSLSVRIGFAVTTDSGVYYGEGNALIAAIHPEMAVSANGESLTYPYAVEIIGGMSIAVGLSEVHGLDVESVSVSDTGDSLAVTVSGANLMFTAADIVTTANQDVSISYSVGGIAQSLTVKFTVLPRPSEDLFDVTNKTVTVASSASQFTSVWTPSSSNGYVYGRSISVSLSNNSYLRNKVTKIEFVGYDASGGEYPVSTNVSSYYARSVTLNPNTSVAYKYLRLTFTIEAGCTIKVVYASANSGASSGSTVRTEVTYNVTKSGNQIPVTFDANGGMFGTGGTVSTINHNYGGVSTYVLPVTPPTREGYELDGWYFNADGTGDAVTSATSVAYGYDHTIYAKWRVADYSVTLDHSDGTGDTDEISVTFGQTFSGKLTTPVRRGYTFDGWFTSGNVRVTDGTAVTAAFDGATLHAEWTAVSYSITLDVAGGSFTGGNTMPTVTFDSSYPALTVPVRAGYTFGGWFTAQNGGGTQITDERGSNANSVKVDNDQAHTLYAKWTANKYTVTLDGRGAIIGTGTLEVTFDALYDLSGLGSVDRVGYDFDGLYVVIGNAEVMVADSSLSNVDNVKVTIASDHILYAKWTAKHVTVTLDADGGSGAPASVDATYDDVYPDGLATKPTKTGYTFGGWWTVDESGQITAASTQIVAGTKVAVTGDVTLKAKWTANTYIIVLVGETVVTETVEYDADAKFGGLPVPTKPGHDFDGWYADAALTNKVNDTSMFDEHGNLVYSVLYAKFMPKTYTVKFNKNVNGENILETTKSVVFGNAIEGLSEITVTGEDGYTFGGWFTESGDGTEITDGAVLDAELIKLADSDNVITLHAHWQEQP